jgi:rsbT co-antagonist protein RsbR
MGEDPVPDGDAEDPRDLEIQRLRRRVAELERTRGPANTDSLAPLLRAIVDNSPAVIFVRDHEKRYLLINKRYEALFHVKREEVRGKTDFDLFPREVAEHFDAHDTMTMETGQASEIEEAVPTEDGLRTYITLKFPIYNADGTIYGVGGIATDITDRKRDEQERAALHRQMLDAQEALVRELSTPLIPLASGVLAMPIIGTIDDRRGQQIVHALLEGITRERARVAILDVTGVTEIDVAAADVLLRTAHAARMLGAEVVLTGIGPHAASTWIDAGADFTGIVTLGNLQAGIAHALRRITRPR